MLPEGLTPEDFGSLAPIYTGSLALAAMTRLAPMLGQDSGKAHVTIKGNIDEDGYRIIEGSITAELSLICQRCLGLYKHPVEESFRVVVVESEAEGEQLPDELEPFVSTGTTVRPLDLAEEELLLALPVIARHPEGACSPPPNRASASRAELSPFAELRGRFGGNG